MLLKEKMFVISSQQFLSLHPKGHNKTQERCSKISAIFLFSLKFRMYFFFFSTKIFSKDIRVTSQLVTKDTSA